MTAALRRSDRVEWLHKSDIAANLATHSRGVDRADRALLASAYHDGAEVDYGFFVGPAAELAAILARAQSTQPITLHRTSNIWIEVDGERARSESYVLAYAEHGAAGAATQRLIGGRYLDTHERRGATWRLTRRLYVMDFNINRPSTAAPFEAAVALGAFAPTGGHGAADPGRALLALHAAAFHSPETSMKSDPAATAAPNDQDFERALAKQALHDLNAAYARAADRADAELMASIFHEGATVVTGIFNGAAAEYARTITDFVRSHLERCFHSFANEWFEVHGDRAVGESYVIAVMTAGGKDTLIGGRYLDAYERRRGVWKITSRTFVTDWTREDPTTFDGAGMYASLATRGRFGKEDPVYALWGA